MTTTWVRLGFYEDGGRTALLPTDTISTIPQKAIDMPNSPAHNAQDLAQFLHTICHLSADGPPDFHLHTDSGGDDIDTATASAEPCTKKRPLYLLGWDVGVFFHASQEEAEAVYVHFEPESGVSGSQIVEGARRLLKLAQELEREREQQPEPEPEPQPEPERGSKRERSSSSDSDSSSGSDDGPAVVPKRARLARLPSIRAPPSPVSKSPVSTSSVSTSPVPTSPGPQQVTDNNGGGSVGELESDLESELESELGHEQQEEDKEDGNEEEEEKEKEEELVTVRFSFTNRMTRSHGVTVPDLVMPQVPAARLLRECEHDVKSHAFEAFMQSSRRGGRGSINERQALALGECLAVRMLVEGNDVLMERSTVGEYAVVGEGGERVLKGTVEMWREKDIDMELLRRESRKL
ncbi:uncharacterized protein BKCO1_1700038 [Diplodia corticola]|uniref:Uncharacterized protein n=1 Tax=Diplodia corticola TaxID=236234 RepID=A0A1J9S4H5_9PEZI|nr:uncharacterized protein BKCO1_1700038 [Diplodia corticola]OJD35439.1 hypothetical protein BKCO1_1700038 [Diplodia corticola]